MKVLIPIKSRSKKYGYIYWGKRDDLLMKELLGDNTEVIVFVKDKSLGLKKIDWPHRRIFLSYIITRNLTDEKNQFILEIDADGKLEISFE